MRIPFMSGARSIASTDDVLANRFHAIAENILIVVFGLLPIVFIPLAAAPAEFTKVLFVIGGIAFALIFYSLSVLRSGTLTFGATLTQAALWSIPLVGIISALLSGDMRDAFIGDTLGVHSVAFLALIALT